MTPVRTWQDLAKLAMLMRCGDAEVSDTNLSWRTLEEPRRDWYAILLSVRRDAMGAPAEPAELAEYLGTAFIEHAQELLAAADVSDPLEWRSTCPVCGAAVGAACEPTHAGERAPGRWVHPERARDGTELDGPPDAIARDENKRRVLAWARARSRAGGEWRHPSAAHPVLPGGQLNERAIAEAVLALAADRQRFKEERFALAGSMDRHGAVRQARLESCILLARQLEIELAGGAGDLTVRETARRLVVDIHELGRGNRWARRHAPDYAAANTMELWRANRDRSRRRHSAEPRVAYRFQLTNSRDGSTILGAAPEITIEYQRADLPGTQLHRDTILEIGGGVYEFEGPPMVQSYQVRDRVGGRLLTSGFVGEDGGRAIPAVPAPRGASGPNWDAEGRCYECGRVHCRCDGIPPR